MSGNGGDGLRVTGAGADNTVVWGNRFGTNAAGTAALPNGGDGISLSGARGSEIGGAVAGMGNLISGNLGNGLSIADSYGPGGTWTLVQANLIGTDVNGAAALPNGGHGILLDNGDKVRIGGTEEGVGNVVSGNLADGISSTNSSIKIEIQRNLIGTGIDGHSDVGNGGHGVFLGEGASRVLIGGLIWHRRRQHHRVQRW